MSAFLTSLGSVANQVGEAGNAAREEKQQQAQKIHGMDVEDAYLQLARQSDQRAAEQQKQALEKGDLIKIGNRLWSVSKGKFVDTQQADPMDALKKFVSTLPKDIQAGAQARAQAVLDAEPGDAKAAIAEVMRYADAQQAESNRRADQATTEKNRREDKRESERSTERLQKMMVDFRLAEKQQYMTPQERQMYDSIKIAEPMVDRLTKFIEDNHLQDQNSYIFGDHSALAQHMRFYGYQKGVEPEKVTSTLIKDAAALKVMGARPWMSMGRGKYLYEDIVQHLPQPTDTPGQLYSKVSWLRDNVLEDAKQSLAGYVQPGGQDNPLGINLSPEPH
jgi:hypothetical protein